MSSIRPGLSKRQTLIALMLPQLMVVLNLSMVNVAVPAIRETFEAPADLVAWVITVYTLSYVALMPLYGRLGDELGIPRMLVVACSVFMVGTAVNALSQHLPLLLVGRFIQGAGASGVVPLCIAMIWRTYASETRGHALGQWNAIGPVASVAGGLVSGGIIEILGWRAIFAVPIGAGAVTLALVRHVRDGKVNEEGLGRFDWVGVILLSATLASMLLYVNSRSITGRAPLSDWRLGLATALLGAVFVRRARTVKAPFIDLSILQNDALVKSSLSAALRMFVMSSTVFLTPLFLTDVKHLGPATIGLVSTVHSAGLFPTMFYGGRVADRWGSRLPIAIGLSVQALSTLMLVFSGSGPSIIVVVIARLLNGLGAGLALPAMHRAAMSQSEEGQGGAASGLYSMIRFWGMMLGTAVAGVLLQSLLDAGTRTLTSYRLAFAASALVAFAGAGVGLMLRERPITRQS